MMTRAGLDSSLREHREALDSYLARARRIPEARWTLAPASGKWSPGEITEHLRIALERLERELAGEPALRCLLPAWRRFVLRLTVLPRMLRRGRFPRGVPAPREIRPSTSGPPRDLALASLSRALDRFGAASADPSARRRLTHPYFGRLRLDRFHRLLALHTRHHGEQLPDGPERS